MAVQPSVSGVFTTWEILKALIDNNGVMCHYVEDTKKYNIWVFNGPSLVRTSLYKAGVSVAGINQTQNDLDLVDFETYYKANANGLERQAIRIESDEQINVNVQSQTLTNKLRYAQMTANQALTKDAYTTIYTYSGSGQFYGFYGNILDSSTEIKVTIDGEDIITDFSIDDIPVGGPGNSGSGGFGTPFLKRSATDQVAVEPPMAVKYNSSITIQLKAHATSSNQRKLVSGYAVLTKE
jgi:hypothetical protein